VIHEDRSLRNARLLLLRSLRELFLRILDPSEIAGAGEGGAA
jgi:glycyl-tRNA synthetase beta subunit